MLAALNDSSQSTAISSMSSRVGTVHHLHKNFLSVLKTLEERGLFNLQVQIATRRRVERNSSHRGSLGIDEGNLATSTAQNQLRCILENDLNDFVAVTHQDRFRCLLPLLDVMEGVVGWSCRGIPSIEVESERLKLAVAVQIALEVLQ